MYGSFIVASSEAFAKAFRSFGQKDAVKGFYLNCYYVDEPATVTGTCATKTYAQNKEDSFEQTKRYNMDLKKDGTS